MNKKPVAQSTKRVDQQPRSEATTQPTRTEIYASPAEKFLQENQNLIDEIEKEFFSKLGVFSAFLEKIEELMNSSNLDPEILAKLRERIYQNIKIFLLILKNSQESEESPELTDLISAIQLAHKWYSAELPESVNSDSLATYLRQFFFLTDAPEISDNTLLLISILLSKVRRWLIKPPDQYALSLVTDDFVESDFTHIIKMMLLFRVIAKITSLTLEELDVLGRVVILHDLPEALVGDFSQGENHGDPQNTNWIRELLKNIEALAFPLVLSYLKPAELWKGFLELYSGYEDRLQPKPSYNINYLIYRLVRLLDKLDSLATIVALEVLDTQEEFQESGYFDRGYSTYLLQSTKYFLQAFEEYAQCAQNSDRFSSQSQPENHLTELITQILQFLENQYNARLAKANRNKTVKITIIDITKIIKQALKSNPNEFTTIRKFMIEAISNLYPENPYDKVIGWFGG